MKVFLIDAYDSFVFIISQYLEQLGLETHVERNDVSDLIKKIEAYAPDFCVLGPGPGHPQDAGYSELIQHFKGRLPILGVCLGHQAIGLAFGGAVIRADHVMHGKISTIKNDGRGVYAHTDERSIKATRYHSLIISDEGLPDVLEVTSTSTDDGYIMGVRHLEYPIEGVQFHPESIMTEGGVEIFRSFIEQYVRGIE
ncbi:anthranilate synthase component II [Pseudomonas syringae]|uniref:Aminodeoxychorismate/anthranilate synthase component II n=2 Tax=Pseudomonas syringae group TaxID=136849 RepID=A0A261WLK4_9PSED|nr:aminodeoxychorismate/anthranilate synthase component II [Pseudomonas syringae]EPN24408.1 anthranilate synthase component II [Pseudomonas syringae pv. actinidiae ICMP 19070]OZI87101.1 aminodeoxychorismate/anthranilate synthase component II [Pseudomonas avellanae]AQL35335.1 aminodeoxychorismate/anthranilate synthase component II [Pseudomonas syringae pv. actinidiae ICMP 9853]ATV20454.1 type 1 glutamine amidotransferase [Pseudomonas syringae pv. actinidiae]EPM47176.1 anthranilate synthase comp